MKSGSLLRSPVSLDEYWIGVVGVLDYEPDIHRSDACAVDA
jgi:hypothetical protein